MDCFRDYFNRLQTQTGKKPKRLHTDNGTGELNLDIDKLTSSLGVIHELTCPFTPEQNARIERDMRTLSEEVGTLLIDSNLSKSFWAEALSCVIYTSNHVNKSSVIDKTPFDLFYNKEPFDVNQLRKFGSRVIVLTEKRKKFDLKGEVGIFIGYEEYTKGYKIYLTEEKRVIVSNCIA